MLTCGLNNNLHKILNYYRGKSTSVLIDLQISKGAFNISLSKLMFIWNPLKKSEIFVNLWIYVLCISHIFYSHPIQVSSSFFLSFYLLVYWLHTSQHVEDECCDLQRETLWSPYLFLISRRPSRIQSPVGRSETRPTCPRAVVPWSWTMVTSVNKRELRLHWDLNGKDSLWHFRKNVSIFLLLIIICCEFVPHPNTVRADPGFF